MVRLRMGQRPECWVVPSEGVHAISDYAVTGNVQDPATGRHRLDISPGVHRCTSRDRGVVGVVLDTR